MIKLGNIYHADNVVGWKPANYRDWVREPCALNLDTPGKIKTVVRGQGI